MSVRRLPDPVYNAITGIIRTSLLLDVLRRLMIDVTADIGTIGLHLFDGEEMDRAITVVARANQKSLRILGPPG